jgi:NAD(P)-dependent dehydrogenase (short-subunit alcohol dehydrogenase family)
VGDRRDQVRPCGYRAEPHDNGAASGLVAARPRRRVSWEESATKAVAVAIEKFGKLDILVNNAARIMSKLVIDMTREDWESIMSVNVTGAFLHSREAMKAMIPNKSGPSLALVPSRFSSRQNA